MQFIAYADAHHGFDGITSERRRTDVPHGVNPGQGVTVGGQAAAREASQRALIEFLRVRFRQR